MVRRTAVLIGLGAAVLSAAMFVQPAAAQNAPTNGVLVIYGNEKCPTDNNGAEIVVCQHRNAGEQFRIPKELREFKVTPENESWAARLQTTGDAGAEGIGSCSTVGVGGASGCFLKQAQAAKAERKRDADADAGIP